MITQKMLPDPEQVPAMDLWPDTGTILGLSRESTYGAARRGEIPTLRLGRRLVVPVAALRLMLGLDGAAGSPANVRRLPTRTAVAMSPPDGEGRPLVTSQEGGPNAENIAAASVTDPLRSVLYVLLSTSYRAGRLAGFCDGWEQGLEAGSERRCASTGTGGRPGMARRTRKARSTSTCPLCRRPVLVGQQIGQLPRGWCHVRCIVGLILGRPA